MPHGQDRLNHGCSIKMIPKSPAHHKIECETEKADPIVEPSKNKPKGCHEESDPGKRRQCQTPSIPQAIPKMAISDSSRASRTDPFQRHTHMQQVAPCLHVDR